MRQAKIRCPHCYKQIIVRDRGNFFTDFYEFILKSRRKK